jgi:hypothetical protein
MRGTAAIHQQAPTPQRHAPKHKSAASGNHSSSSAATLGMSAMAASTVDEARSMAPLLPFQLMVPQYQFTGPSAGPDLLRRYDIHGPGRRLYPAYVLVLDLGGLGEFYDVQGTTWNDPPLLGTPSASVQAGKRTYELYYDGEHIKTVSWHEYGAVYWIENTLNNGLSAHHMVAVAQETVPIVSAQSSSTSLQPTVVSITIPARTRVSSSTLAGKAGAAMAIVVLFLLAGLTAILLRRRRELQGLRVQVAAALRHEARQRSAVAGSSVHQTAPLAVGPVQDRPPGPE